LLKDVEQKRRRKDIIDQIKVHLQEARDLAGDQVKILESSNLKGHVESGRPTRLRDSPRGATYKFFRDRG